MQVDIQQTITRLLQQEDTDGDKRITVDDAGPKRFELKGPNGQTEVVSGTFHLSNLLQELAIAAETGEVKTILDFDKIREAPVTRISRMIREYFWDGLTRSMDAQGIQALLSDSKNETIEADMLTVYVPQSDPLAKEYYEQLSTKLPLRVVQLPTEISPEYVKSLNDSSGILSLQLQEVGNEIKATPFVVPGGRFNEMYGWDSYFESIGLLLDGRTDLAQGMADNFRYEINHYGKILNANRSYYLTRTQPPFYTRMISEVFEKTNDRQWLRKHIETAIWEYENVWMVSGKRLTANGLNRYLAEGIGRPPEAEAGHFHHEFQSHADGAGLSVEAYEEQYATGAIQNEEIDHYFIHDRSVRESGHDTSYRLEGKCADLNLVELNAFLYKYETDFAQLIAEYFEGDLEVNGRSYTLEFWKKQAENRRAAVDRFLWNEERGMYFDFNQKDGRQETYISATGLIPLWAGLCSDAQAQKLVAQMLPKLIEAGGVVSCTEESRGPISKSRPQKQWDYPNGWAPHQMMIWKGLQDYGYTEVMTELVYRWLYMITKNAVDYNGTIPEKYDVVAASHQVFAEYGNVGTEFEYITKEGFGWMNASYQYGISLLSEDFISQLNQLTPPQQLFD